MPVERCRSSRSAYSWTTPERLDARPRCRASRSASEPVRPSVGLEALPDPADVGRAEAAELAGLEGDQPDQQGLQVVLEGEHHAPGGPSGRCCGRPGAPRWSCPAPAGRRAAPARRSGSRRRGSGRARRSRSARCARRGATPARSGVLGLLQDAAQGFQREIHPVIGAPERRAGEAKRARNHPNGAERTSGPGRPDLAARDRSRRLPPETRDRRSSACRTSSLEGRHSTEGPAQRAACAGDTE